MYIVQQTGEVVY